MLFSKRAYLNAQSAGFFTLLISPIPFVMMGTNRFIKQAGLLIPDLHRTDIPYSHPKKIPMFFRSAGSRGGS
jgi:hypothetical protein